MIGSVQYMTGPNGTVSDIHDLRIVGNLAGGVWVGMILELLKMLFDFYVHKLQKDSLATFQHHSNEKSICKLNRVISPYPRALKQRAIFPYPRALICQLNKEPSLPTLELLNKEPSSPTLEFLFAS